jgi:hypothetical protein
MSVLLDETPVEVRALRVPSSEWKLILRARPNLLVEGPHESTERLIAVLASHSPAPPDDWRHSTESAPDAALLVRDVDTLSAEDQRELMNRIKGDEGPFTPRQVISTSATPVFPLIERGLFLEALYYRLNSVRLTIGEAR